MINADMQPRYDIYVNAVAGTYCTIGTDTDPIVLWPTPTALFKPTLMIRMLGWQILYQFMKLWLPVTTSISRQQTFPQQTNATFFY